MTNQTTANDPDHQGEWNKDLWNWCQSAVDGDACSAYWTPSVWVCSVIFSCVLIHTQIQILTYLHIYISIKVWMNGGCVGAAMNGWMGGWMDGWMDINVYGWMGL